ncbi:MAG: hypothetical protein ACLFUR_02005 [Candidatus Hadarchaeia archaeon]
MPIQDPGAICDVSALKNRNTLNRTLAFFNNSGLYIPNSTYSWLRRSKFIEVRNQAVRYSLIQELVRNRRIFPTHLPGIYDELSRKVMFETDHGMALTDLRALMLSTHLKLPILTYDEELMKKISRTIGIRRINQIKTSTDWLSISRILEAYRTLSFDAGKKFYQAIDENNPFPKIKKKISSSIDSKLTEISDSTENSSEDSSETLKFKYFIWNIFPFIREYHRQRILEPETTRQICERCALLIAYENNKVKSVGKKSQASAKRIDNSGKIKKDKNRSSYI